MIVARTLYWLLTGALIGFGVSGMASIGLPFLLLGLLLVIVGAIRLGARGSGRRWSASAAFRR
jgi:hypothetical protein